MGRSYVEAAFRHKYLLILPIVLGFLAGTLVAFTIPRQYVAGATIWADNPVPGESTVGTTGGQSPPSAGQAALLTQMLGTRTFLRSVVEVSPLAEQYRSADPLTGMYLLYEVAGSVAVSAPGPQLLSVSVRRDNAAEAIAITEAVLDQFEQYRIVETTNRAEAQAKYDYERLQAAGEALRSSPGNRAAESAYAEALETYNASSLQAEQAQASGVKLIDAPDLAVPQARRKTLILGAIGGLLAGLTVSVIALIVLMARDNSVRDEDDASDSLGLEVVGSIPKASLRVFEREPAVRV